MQSSPHRMRNITDQPHREAEMKIEELKKNFNMITHREIKNIVLWYRESANKVVRLLDYIPEELKEYDGWAFGVGMWPLGIDLPADFELINEIRDKFVAAGWEIGRDEPTKYGYILKFTHPEITSSTAYVIVSFSTYREGSTCKVQKIGTVTREEPVYEVVCTDGAEEPTW